MVVVVTVFDIGYLHVNGREGKEGGGVGPTSKRQDGKGETGGERKGGEGKEREERSLP